MDRVIGRLAVAACVLCQPVWAQEGQESFLVCDPSHAGRASQAKSTMEALGSYLSSRLDGTWRPSFTNDPSAGRVVVEKERTRFGIVTLPLYLSWREELKLTPLAVPQRQEKTLEPLHVLVAADAEAAKLADLSGKNLWSLVLEDAVFAQRVAFAGKLEVANVHRPRSVLRALRALRDKQPLQDRPVEAVVVDDRTWRGLRALKGFQGRLKSVFDSKPLPLALVVSIGDVPAADAAALSTALSRMQGDEQGRKLLKTLQTTAFVTPPSEVLERVRQSYGKGDRE